MTFRIGRTRAVGRCALSAVLVLLALLGPADLSAAQQVRVGREVVVRADELISDDLYAFGDTVVIEGTVKGDVMAVAREVRLRGTVEGDLSGCAQTYLVDGRVGDDLRIAGMTVLLGRDARVGDDLATAAGGLETQAGSSIAGSLLFVGYRAQLAGDVVGDLRAEAVELELNGGVGGDVDTAVSGEGERSRLAWSARQAASVLIVGVLVAWVAPGTFRTFESRLRGRTLRRLGMGAAGVAALFAQALGVSIVVISLGLVTAFFQLWLLLPAVSLAVFAEGVVLAGFGMLAVFAGPAGVSAVVGRSILRRLAPDRAGGILLPLVLGLSLLAVLMSIPYVGFLVQLVVVLLGVSALWPWPFDSSGLPGTQTVSSQAGDVRLHPGG